MATNNEPIDAGHFSFLEMVKVLTAMMGPAVVKGALVRTGTSAAPEVDEITFSGWDEFIKSIDEIENPIAQFEGQAKEYEEGIFGLPVCPFAGSLKTYKDFIGNLPDAYGKVTEELNKQSAQTTRLKIGEGAAVSPFCGVHQTIRSALGSRIKVGDKPLTVYQLGCKSGAGEKGIAEHYCKEANVDPSVVNTILDENMCCYCIRPE